MMYANIIRNLGIKNINTFGQIKIGNNVFIGVRSILLPNIEIRDNVIIEAGYYCK